MTVLEDNATYAGMVELCDAVNRAKPGANLRVGECWVCHRPHVWAGDRSAGSTLVQHHEKTCGRYACGQAVGELWAGPL